MQYQSTRTAGVHVASARAIAEGICADGGLYVPESCPVLTDSDFAALEAENYPERAARILSLFLTDFTKEEIADCVSQAYAEWKFSGGNAAPLKNVADGVSFLELWHGPTCAFKDMALQLLPHLLTRSLKKTGTEKEALILVATSGDTGKAALEGFRDVPGTSVLVFYPQDGVSPLQNLQMRTQEGENVAVCAVKGNFDDAQTGVKKLFADSALREAIAERGLMFSSANSINWGRLVPQIVYYFSAYCDLTASGAVKRGQPVNITVPTGNFGDILAAYYAKKMGLPVKKLICASNSNNVLTDFLRTGVYSRNRKFYTTISPSMDILVSSNLERLLFDLTGGDGEKVSGWMKQLTETGEYRVDGPVLSAIRELFYAGFCGDDDTRSEVKRVFQAEHTLCDPHTAVASAVAGAYRKETGDETPMIVVSTASPYKFSSDVLEALIGSKPAEGDEFSSVEALSSLTGTAVPGPIAALREKPTRFKTVCQKEEMGAAVLKFSRRDFV